MCDDFALSGLRIYSELNGLKFSELKIRFQRRIYESDINVAEVRIYKNEHKDYVKTMLNI
jgi:hypothetical protein